MIEKYRIKIVALLFLLTVSFYMTYAQNNCDISGTDASVEAGQTLAECGDYDAAITMLSDLLNTSPDDVERAAVQMALGAVYYETENYFDAQIQYERAFISYNAAEMPAQAGEAYTGAGLAKVGRRQFAEAGVYFSEALERSEEAGDIANLARTNLALAQLNFRQGNNDLALENTLAALTHYQSIDNQQDVVRVLKFRVEIFLAQGNIIDAFSDLDAGIEIARNIKANEDLAPMLLQLAQARIINGQYAEAEGYLLEAGELFQSFDDTTGQITVLIALADVYTKQGNYPAADTSLQNAGDATATIEDCGLNMRLNNAQGNFFNAIGRYETAFTIFTETVSNDCSNDYVQLVARAQLGLGQVWLNRGYTIFGGDEYQFALGNFRNINDPVGEVDVLILLSAYYLRRNRTDQAYDFGFTASTIAEETGNTDGLIRAQIALSDVDIRIGSFDEAFIRLENTLNLAFTNNNLAMQAATLEQLADLYFNQARYEEAITFWERAQEAYGSEDNVRYDAQLEFNRALIFQATGDIARALNTYESSRALFDEIDELDSIIRIDLIIGQLYVELNLFEQAEPFFNTALQSADATGNIGLRADTLTNLGRLDLSRIDFAGAQHIPLSDERETELLDSAQIRFFEALQTYIILEDPLGQANVLNELGLLGVRRLIPVRFGTGGFFLNALQISRETGNIVLEADVLSNLGYYNEIVGQSGQAITYYQQSLRMADGLNPVLATRNRIRLAQLYERRGDMVNARLYYNESINALESLYILLGSQSERTEFGSQLENLLPYERLIRYYGLNIIDGRERDAATALDYVERNRARSLLLQLGSGEVDFNEDDSTVLELWQSKRDELLELYDLLDTTQQQGLDTESLSADIASIESEIATIQDGEEIGSLLQALTIDTVELAELQATLPENSAMIIYHIAPEIYTETQTEAGRIFTFVVTRDSITQTPTLIQSYQDDIVNPINLFRRNPNNTNPLINLHALLIDPISDAIRGVDQLIIVPHDMLNYLPYETLRDEEGNYLVDQYSISYSPSATIYQILQQRNNTTTEADALILNYGDDLIFAREEAETVASTLGTMSLHDTEASETWMRENAASASVIHIAAHGEFNPQQALDSYLSLAPDDINDGLFSVREIYSLNLQENNPLVVLSACNTAVSELNPGDEFQNMTRAFLLTGARSVVASLWAVDDVATSELMVEFYNNRAAGMSDSEALASAKRVTRENFPNPYFWAGFVLIGTG